MRVLMLLWALVASACAESDTEYVKSVKGGGNRYQEKVTEYWSRFNNTQRAENHVHEELETVGVCYIEVPTINLVIDPSNVPMGNGSRSDLSRIRSCCAGYTKNRHNPMVCDPVCSKECVNALCVAPETCKCYPDYIKNKGGFCIPTCPIGCQNGNCAGGECICHNGYELDRDGKFCVPTCRDGCGSGNCTAPNTCSCTSGFQSTPCNHESAKIPKCDNCEFGQCVGDQRCRCYPGYSLNPQGKCTPQCSYPCSPGSSCIAPNVCAPSTTGNETEHHYFMSPITIRPTTQPANQVTNTLTDHHNPSSTPKYPHNYGYYPNGTRIDGHEPNQYPQSNYGSYPVSPRPTEHPQSNQNASRDLGPNSNQTPQPNYYGIYPRPPGPNEQRYPNRNRGDIETQTDQDVQSIYTPNIGPQRTYEQYPGTAINHSPNNPYDNYGQVPNNIPNGPNYPYNQRPDAFYNSGNQIFNSTSNYPNSRPLYPAVPGPYYNINMMPYNSQGYQTPNNTSNYPNSGATYPNGYNSSQVYPYPNQGPGMSLYPGNQQQYNPQGSVYPNRGPYPANQYSDNDRYYPNYPNSGHTIEVFNQVSNESRSQNQSNTFHTQENRHNSNYPDTEDLLQTDERVPVCSLPCINAHCVSGNICMCNQGYIPDRIDPNKCLPHCPGGCLNGVCSAPRICLCNVGYRKDTSIKGRQVCVKHVR